MVKRGTFRQLLILAGVLGLSGLAFAQYVPDPRNAEMLEYSRKYRPGYLDGEDYGRAEINPYQNKVRGGASFYSPYIRHGQPLEEEMSFSKLVGLIREKKLTTIESVIDALPYEMKDQNYVLMYRSRSLQEATPEAPRAIVFTPSASFMLSFNGGNPGFRGAQTIEAIQFDQKTSRFEFRELAFDGKCIPRISEPNPAKCLECHQSPTRQGVDMRPNWEPYFVWLGAYGSNDGDFIFRSLRQTMAEKLLPQDNEVLNEQEQEFELFKRYINDVAPKHPRYSRLGRFNLHAPVELSEHVTVWGLKRAVRLFKEETVIYPLYREAFAWMASCSITQKEILASPALQWHMQFQYPQYYNYFAGTLQTASARITQLLEPLGIDTSDWSTDFGSGGRFAFYERFGTPSNTMTILKYAWEVGTPELASSTVRGCEELKATALAKIDQAYGTGELLKIRESRLAPQPQAQQILARCVTCHASGDQVSRIPHIPFNQPSLLAERLKGPATTHPRTLLEEIQYRSSDMATQTEQMPPSHRLSSVERSTLMKYLKEIVK